MNRSTSLAIEIRMVSAQNVQVTEDALIVDLSDGRTVSVPLAWFPRLLHGKPEERNTWRLIGDGEGIHWPELDEDISVENLILGKPSGESQKPSRSGWKRGQNPLNDENAEIFGVFCSFCRINQIWWPIPHGYTLRSALGLFRVGEPSTGAQAYACGRCRLRRSGYERRC
jgi:hypothetical protein